MKNLFDIRELQEDELSADIVVVGSGAGGATIAAELAEAGFDVLVLEEGPHVRTAEFSGDAIKMTRLLYRDSGTTIALGNPPVLYQEGRAVGGTTVINGGMSWRTPEPVLRTWERELGTPDIGPTQMTPYFERVEKRTHVRMQSDDSIGVDNRLFQQAAKKLQWEVIPNLRNQHHCVGSNNCLFGCPTGAKQSALVSYLPRATHFGARIYHHARVDKLEIKRGVASKAIVQVSLPRGTKKISVFGNIFIVACGAIHTPGLLHRTGVKNRQLGRDLSLHPNSKIVAVMDKPVRGWEGVHQAFQVREFHRQGLLFASVNIPPSLVAMTCHKSGQELHEFMNKYSHMLVAGVMVEDTSRGRVSVDPLGSPRASYQLNSVDYETLLEGLRRCSRLLFEAGAVELYLPMRHSPVCRTMDQVESYLAQAPSAKHAELFTVHLMGTAKMGAEGRSVVDKYGRLHGSENIFVTDASVFPTPIGVNPMETIQALATRTAGYIIQERTS